MRTLMTDWKGVSAGDLVMAVHNSHNDCPHPHPIGEGNEPGWREIPLQVGSIHQVEGIYRSGLCHCYSLPNHPGIWCNGTFRPYKPGEDRQELLRKADKEKELVNG